MTSDDKPMSDLDRILGGLKATAPTPKPAEPSLDDILAGLTASAAPAAPPEPSLDDLLSSLAAPATPAAPPEPSLDDILAGLSTPAAPPEPSLDDLLSSLAAPATPAAPPEPSLDDILAGLSTPAAPPEPSLDDILAGLGAPATPDPAPAPPRDAPTPATADPAPAAAAPPEAPPADAPAEAATAPDAPPAPKPPYAPDFGTLTAEPFARPAAGRGKFRLAVLGDFSGRAGRGALEGGRALGERKAMKLDVDTIERVIGRFRTRLELPIGPDGSVVEVELGSLDDLHPDELFGNLELFSDLATLRRQVKSGAARTLADLKAWGIEHGAAAAAPRPRASGAALACGGSLQDFASLIGAKAAPKERAATDELIARIVGPFVVAAPSPDQPAMLAAVDAALSAAMKTVLHHPDFQTVEALWRMLDLLARRVETDAKLEIVVYDIAVEELAGDLAAASALEKTGLFTLLAEKPVEDEGEGPIGAIVGLYSFEETPPHAEILGRMARIAAHIGAPFLSAIGTGFLGTKPEDRHPLVRKAWDGLRALPEAQYLGLATPRFLLRRPYGKRTDPIDSFAFEEFSETEGLRGMLFANPAILAGILLCETVKRGGKAADLGSIMTLDDIPFLHVRDQYGDQVALPCTERLFSQSVASEVTARGLMPVLSMKGRNVVRLGSFQSLGGGTIRGAWAQATPGAAAGVEVRLGGPGPATVAVTAPAAAPAPAAPADDDLDSLLAGLSAPAPAPATPAPAADDDLDALLAGLSDPAPAPAAAAADDEDLDALLASLTADVPPPAGDDDMDPELKALLGDL